MNTKVATVPTRVVLFGTKKHMPAVNKLQVLHNICQKLSTSCPRIMAHMFGNVKISRVLRPKVSIVHIAGKAKMKLVKPKPQEMNKALRVSNPALTKMVAE